MTYKSCCFCLDLFYFYFWEQNIHRYLDCNKWCNNDTTKFRKKPCCWKRAFISRLFETMVERIFTNTLVAFQQASENIFTKWKCYTSASLFIRKAIEIGKIVRYTKAGCKVCSKIIVFFASLLMYWLNHPSC